MSVPDTPINTGNSCAGRCGQAQNQGYSCDCDASCIDYGSCCVDYSSTCAAGSSYGGWWEFGTDFEEQDYIGQTIDK